MADNPSSSSNSTPEHRVWRVIHGIEDVLLAIALGGVMAIPLLEMLLRSPLFRTSLIGGGSMTQHLTLLVSILGAAVAARQARLLTISHGFARAPAPWGAVCEALRAGGATGVSVLLVHGAWVFYLNEREGGRTFAFGIPVWVPLLLLVGGLALIGIRLVQHAGGWPRRVAALAIGAAVALVVWQIEPESKTIVWLLLGLLLVSVVLGAPVFTLLGGAAAFLFWGEWIGLDAIADEYYKLSTNPLIPSLPLFTLAGYFLAEGGTSARMVRLLRALVGDMKAGPALVTVVACAFFTSLTGASGVTILALGGLLVPFLIEARYSEKASIGLLTGAGSIGLLFAPCLPLILYAIIAKVPIEAMFLGGVGPGLLLGAAVVVWAAWRRPPADASARHWSFDAKELGSAAWQAFPELMIPVVSLGSIFAGWATPVEAAAFTAFYALLIEMLIYRDLKPRALVGVMRECGLLIGGVLLILGVAQGLTAYFNFAQVPEALFAFVQEHIESRIAFIALLTVVLLIVGCMMDVFSAIIVVVPLIALPGGLGESFGLDPIHLGILFLANLGLGFLTPPVGMNLFLSSLRFNKPMGEVLRASLPYFGLQLIVVLVISYWPDLSLFLPRAFGVLPE